MVHQEKREYDNGKYEYSFKIVLEDDYNTIAETEYYPVQMEYDWDVHVEIDGKRKGLDKDNNEANVDVDNNEDCKLKVTPYFVQGFDKNLFHYKWKMSEWSLDDYGDLDAVQQNDLNAGDINEISVDTRNLEAGKRYRYRCYVGYDEAADENCYYVDILLYIRTDDEMAADKVSKMINGIDAYHMTLADEASVKAARAAYELLTEAQKKELGSFDEDYLLYLEKRIKEIKNAAAAAKAKAAKIKAAQAAKVGNLKAKALKKRKVQLTWKVANGVSGIEVYQSNKKNGTYKKVATLKASVTKWKSKKIKKGKKAFFKVRPFTNIGGKNFFGKFAATSVKLKK